MCIKCYYILWFITITSIVIIIHVVQDKWEKLTCTSAQSKPSNVTVSYVVEIQKYPDQMLGSWQTLWRTVHNQLLPFAAVGLENVQWSQTTYSFKLQLRSVASSRSELVSLVRIQWVVNINFSRLASNSTHSNPMALTTMPYLCWESMHSGQTINL